MLGYHTKFLAVLYFYWLFLFVVIPLRTYHGTMLFDTGVGKCFLYTLTENILLVLWNEVIIIVKCSCIHSFFILPVWRGSILLWGCPVAIRCLSRLNYWGSWCSERRIYPQANCCTYPPSASVLEASSFRLQWEICKGSLSFLKVLTFYVVNEVVCLFGLCTLMSVFDYLFCTFGHVYLLMTNFFFLFSDLLFGPWDIWVLSHSSCLSEFIYMLAVQCSDTICSTKNIHVHQY